MSLRPSMIIVPVNVPTLCVIVNVVTCTALPSVQLPPVDVRLLPGIPDGTMLIPTFPLATAGLMPSSIITPLLACVAMVWFSIFHAAEPAVTLHSAVVSSIAFLWYAVPPTAFIVISSVPTPLLTSLYVMRYVLNAGSATDGEIVLTAAGESVAIAVHSGALPGGEPMLMLKAQTSPSLQRFPLLTLSRVSVLAIRCGKRLQLCSRSRRTVGLLPTLRRC